MKRDLKRFFRSMFRVIWWKIRGVPVFAPEDIVGARRRICRPCCFNVAGDCRVCTCVIRAKTLLSAESCPEDKWGSVK